MVSNSLRVRKQFGTAWFVFYTFMFIIEIPVFAFCSFFNHLFHGKNPLTEWKKIKGFTLNVYKVCQLLPKIISGKAHFYKML